MVIIWQINPPKIFHVNWFRTDENGNSLWPGYNENLRILEWVLERCNNKLEAIKSPIGYIPKTSDIDMTGLQLPSGALDKLLAIDRQAWLEESKNIKEFFTKFGKDLPEQLWQEYDFLLYRLGVATHNHLSCKKL